MAVLGSAWVRWLVAVSVLAVLALAGGLVGWSKWAAAQRDAVVASWGDVPHCSGTTLFQEPGDNGRGLSVPARPGMACTFVLHVTNTGAHRVTIKQVAAPWLGPGSEAPVKASVAAGSDAFRTDPDDDRNVVYPIDTELGPGESVNITVGIGFRPSGCSSSGTLITVPHWLSVDVSAGGRSGVVTTNGVLLLRGTTFSSCDT